MEIRDAADGKAIADLARGTVIEGAFSDSLWPHERSSSALSDLFSRQSAGERPGVYRIHVERADYSSWDTTGVVVTRNVCHVNTVRVFVRLVPNP